MEFSNLSQGQNMTYQSYLLTDYWKQVSVAVKNRAGNRCQVCNRIDHLQAHHRTYAHRGHELEHLDDLTCLCDRCHALFHQGSGTPKPPAPPELVEITEKNFKRLRCTKEPWHWMLDNGINPEKKGWARRAIGFHVPKQWLRVI